MNVTVENLVKEFGQTPALHGVSLEIAGGELIALLGPSGSGKTTLLRLIAGLDFPTSGRVMFGNEDASAKSVQDRHVGFVFQSYALFRHMTVYDNLAFGLRVRPRATRPGESAIRERNRDFALKGIISNAAALPQKTKELVVDYFGDGLLHECYGSTEAAIVTSLRPADQLRDPLGMVDAVAPFRAGRHHRQLVDLLEGTEMALRHRRGAADPGPDGP